MPQRASTADSSPSWDCALTEPLKLRDGAVLRTLQDAADLLLERSKCEPLTWDITAAAILEAANHPTKPNISEATKAMKIALFLRHLSAGGYRKRRA